MVKKMLIYVVRFYQLFISPIKGRTCRFYPTCSEYTIQAMEKYGLIKGSFKAIIRILKCHPFHPGGHDPV
ncbi:membrane protein insertion efficiency factor YidD [Desulfallas sp. Bu1-1]|uniref:membrane protein insertion efficiency factor YidD n=1 Tax=Desulfallas sp. Bu1-1 TaxID=2787620 RepID=UPI0018A04BE6|nr:membrane protein insertion efficiency factor YidD [Desulfallas sp. Bu1-1]MBF7081375.1 membrane protein insertion efficiency factor YidD [Desulfallas sp. Bu1-1]